MYATANVRCPPGQVVSSKTGKCIKDKRKPCLDGKQRNPKTGRCTKRLKPCDPGYVRNPVTNHCIKQNPLDSKTVAGGIKPAPRPNPRPTQTGATGAGPSTSQHPARPGAKPHAATTGSGKGKQPHHSGKQVEHETKLREDIEEAERRAKLRLFFNVANEIHSALLDARSQSRVCVAYEYMADKYSYPFPKVCKLYLPKGHHLKRAVQYKADNTMEHLQEDWEEEMEDPVKVPKHLQLRPIDDL